MIRLGFLFSAMVIVGVAPIAHAQTLNATEALPITKQQAAALLDGFDISSEVPLVEKIRGRLVDEGDRQFVDAMILTIDGPGPIADLVINGLLSRADLSANRRSTILGWRVRRQIFEGNYSDAAISATQWRTAAISASDLDDIADAEVNLQFARAFQELPPMTLIACKNQAVDIVPNDRNFLIVNGNIKHQSVVALLDTGAPFGYLYKSAADRLGVRYLTAHLDHALSNREVSSFTLGVLDHLEVASCELRNVPVIVGEDVDRSIAGGVASHDIIVGTPVLRMLSPFRAEKAGVFYPKIDAVETAKSNVYFRGNKPYIRAGINGVATPLSLDTGSDITRLTDIGAKTRLQIDGSEPTYLIDTLEVDGVRTSQRFCARNVKLTFANAVIQTGCLEANVPSEHTPTRGRLGFLGMDILSHFKSFTVDLNARTLMVKANDPSPAVRDP